MASHRQTTLRRSDLLQRDRAKERRGIEGQEDEKGRECCAGEKLNQWLNYCMIAHSPKTWASFGRKCLIIGFRPCQTHAIPPANGSVRKNWASWVREGRKIARRQKSHLHPHPFFFLLFPQINEGMREKEKDAEKARDDKKERMCMWAKRKWSGNKCSQRGNALHREFNTSDWGFGSPPHSNCLPFCSLAASVLFCKRH